MSNMIEYPVGSIYITSTNTNPDTLGVPGVWELVEKKFKTIMGEVGSDNFTPNTSVCTLGGCRIFRDDQHVYVKLVVNTVIDISESDQTLGTINLATIGLDQWVNMYMVGESDNGDAMICGYTYNSNGTVRTYDIISKTSGASLPSGSTIRINIEWVPHTDAMLDSACNRFYWKKTAEIISYSLNSYLDTVYFTDSEANVINSAREGTVVYAYRALGTSGTFYVKESISYITRSGYIEFTMPASSVTVAYTNYSPW